MAGLAALGLAALGLAALGLAAACSLPPAPTPIPLAGPAPATVLILPVHLGAGVGPAEVATALEQTLGEELRQRGYRPIPAAAARAALESAATLGGPEPAPSFERQARIARQLGADALLSIRVERWDAVRVPGLVAFSHDLGYRLWDARSEIAAEDGPPLLWELRSRDSWRRDAQSEPPVDPDVSLESYLEGSTPRLPRGDGAVPERSDVELARQIHRQAMAHLPVGPLR